MKYSLHYLRKGYIQIPVLDFIKHKKNKQINKTILLCTDIIETLWELRWTIIQCYDEKNLGLRRTMFRTALNYDYDYCKVKKLQ